MPSRSAARPGRLLGLYALTIMAREGPLHGYALSERIAERTGGSWRPGAGAVYPALRRLEERGLAVGRRDGVRRPFSITPRGRALLRQFAARPADRSAAGPDTTALWMEIVGERDRGQFLLRRLRRHLDEALRYAEATRGTVAGRAFDRAMGIEIERVRLAVGVRSRPRGRGRRPEAA